MASEKAVRTYANPKTAMMKRKRRPMFFRRFILSSLFSFQSSKNLNQKACR